MLKRRKPCRGRIDTLWENDFGNSMSVLDVPSFWEDRMVFDLMQNSIKSVDGHYSLPLPWRPNVKLPANNLSLAQQRLVSLRKRLAKDQVFHDQYTKVVETYTEKGYARKIPADEKPTDALQWYFPHHSVTNPRKPNKVRVVFDCAAIAKYRGLSSNDALMQGSDQRWAKSESESELELESGTFFRSRSWSQIFLKLRSRSRSSFCTVVWHKKVCSDLLFTGSRVPLLCMAIYLFIC